MTMGYQNCIFDLYGTLVDIHTDEWKPEFWEQVAKEYAAHGAEYEGAELQEAYAALVKQKEQGQKQLRKDSHEAHPEIQIEDVFQELYRRKGIDADRTLAVETGRKFRAYSTDYIRLYDGAAELLKTLKQQGKGVYLLSNAQRIFTEYELETLGLDVLFDRVFISSDYGCKKPDKRFFELMMEACSVKAEGAIMIGNDGICDIQGAKNVGLSTLYIRSNISPKEPLPEADYVLEEMNLYRVKDILCAD
jgi:putative hydrolase of the HAD superfamily